MLNNYNPFKTHLFTDDKDQILYYDYQSKMGYYIPKDQMNKYYVFSNRILIAILVAVLLVNVFLTLAWSILVAVMVEIAMGFFFYKSFLPELRKIDKVHLEKLSPYKRIIQKEEGKAKQVLKLCLYLALSLLLVLNAIDQNMLATNPLAFYLSCGCAVAVFIYAIFYGLQMNKK